MEKNEQLKTGTTTIGLVCEDSVVLAADKRATAGNQIVNKHANKVVPVNERMALTKSGLVSDSQLLIKLLKAELNLKELNDKREVTVKEASSQLSRMVYSNIRQFSSIPGVTHFLFGGYDSKGPQLFDIFPDGSVTDIAEQEGFVASGSGSVFAYGVLENSYEDGLSEDEGVDLAVDAINAALQRDSASGQGIDVAVIDEDGFEMKETKLVDTRAT